MAENIETVMELKNNVLVAMDEKGKKFVVIPQIIFKGKRSISWKEVEKYLVRYIGKIFAVSETEDLILVDRMFVDEYTGLDYTNKLVGALPKVKANMSQGIPKMIEIATEKRWKEDFDSKHKNRAGKGWFRYNTRFAMPITNDDSEIIEYKIYQAVLIVRYSTDGKLYLYDIQNIKKKRDTHHGRIRQMVRNPLLLKMIVIQITKKSKDNFMNQNNKKRGWNDGESYFKR